MQLARIGWLASLLPMAILAQDPPAPATTPEITNPRQLRADSRSARPVELTAEQRAKIEAANAAYHSAVQSLEQQLRATRRELEMAVNADKLDENAIRAKAKALADVETELALARARRIAKLREFLSPELVRRFGLISPGMDRRFQPIPEPPSRLPGRSALDQPQEK